MEADFRDVFQLFQEFQYSSSELNYVCVTFKIVLKRKKIKIFIFISEMYFFGCFIYQKGNLLNT